MNASKIKKASFLLFVIAALLASFAGNAAAATTVYSNDVVINATAQRVTVASGNTAQMSKDLIIDNTATTDLYPGVLVRNNGSLDVAGATTVEASGTGYTTGIIVYSGGAVTLNTLSVDGASTTSPTGVDIYSGATGTFNSVTVVDSGQGIESAGTVHVLGDVVATHSTGGSGTSIGIMAMDGTTTVDGDVKADGLATTGVQVGNTATGNFNTVTAANGGAGITTYGTTNVSGDVSASGNNSRGLYIQGGTTTVYGTVSADNTGAVGAYVNSGGNTTNLTAIEATNGATGASVYTTTVVSTDVTASSGATGITTGFGATTTVQGTLTASDAGTTGVSMSESATRVNLVDLVAQDGATGARVNNGVLTVTDTATADGTNSTGVRISNGTANLTDLVASGGATGANVSNGVLTVTDTATASGANSTGVAVSYGTANLAGVEASGDNAAGVKVSGGTATVSGVLTVGDGAYGVMASGGRTFAAAVNVIGPNAYGVYASNDAPVYVSEDITLGPDAAGSYGAVADTGGKVYISGDINSTAVGEWDKIVHGAYTSRDGTIVIDGSVDMQGDYSVGVYAENASSIDVGGSVTTHGHNFSDAVDAYGGSYVNVTGDATTYGDWAWGVHASGVSTDVHIGGNVETMGADSYGVEADDQATVTVDGRILTHSDDAYGIYAHEGATVNANSGVATSGDRSIAAYVDSGTVNVTGNAETSGNNSTAAYADGGTVNITGDVTTQGGESKGLWAENAASIDVGGSVTTYGDDYATAVDAYGGSYVNVTGDAVTHGDWAWGVHASGVSTDVRIGGNVETMGADSYGVEADDQATVTVDGRILTHSDDAYGIYAHEGATVNAGRDVATSGDRSIAAYAEGSAINITGDVTTQGDGSLGLWADLMSSVDVGGSVVTYGDSDGVDYYSDAVNALGGSYVNVDGDAITHGYNAWGVYAGDESTDVRIGGSVETFGEYSIGVEAYDDAAVTVEGWILTHSDDSEGAYAKDNGTINVNSGIVTEGDNATAAHADGGTINIVNFLTGGHVMVMTNGENSHGLYAEDSGVINMTHGLITNPGTDNSWRMYTNTGGTINLDDVTAQAPSTLHLLQTDSTGTVNANRSSLLGDITHTGVDNGELDVNLTGGTKFIGAANELGGNADAWINITLNAISDDFGATDYWQVTKDSNMQGDLTNRGMIDFVHPTSADFNGLNAYVVDDSAYKKITINDFAGTANSGDLLGQLIMKADINANKGDYIYGVGAATGNNDVDLQLMTYAGAERMDQALVYVEDGLNSDATFTLLDNAVTENGIADAGAWNYILEEGMDGAAKEWYLKRNGLTVLGQGLVMGAVTPELWYTEVATLYDRMSDYKNPQYKGGIWASASYRKVEFDGEGGAFGMLPFDVKMKTLTVGYDQKNNHSNGTWYHGFMLGYGQEERDNWAADADTDSMHLSIYTVYKKESGFYLSALAKYNHYDTDLTVNKVDKLTQQFGYDQVTGGLKQRGLGISMMTGKRFNMGDNGWYWEPQMQLSYMRIFGDKFITNSGLDVDVEATTSLRARAGFLFGKAFTLQNGHQLDLFADLSYNKEFDGETDIWLSGGKYTRDLGDAWGSYGLGFSWKMGERSYLGGRIAYGSGSDRTEPISATLGLLFETN